MAKKAINEYDNCCVKYSKWLHSAHASLIIWRMNATACYLERTSSETLYSPKTELQPPNRLWFDRSSQFVALNRYENKQCQQFHMKIFLQCFFFPQSKSSSSNVLSASSGSPYSFPFFSVVAIAVAYFTNENRVWLFRSAAAKNSRC